MANGWGGKRAGAGRPPASTRVALGAEPVPSIATDTTRHAWESRMEARVAHLEQRVGVSGGPRRVSVGDEARLLVLLPTLASVFGSQAFTTADVVGSAAAAVRVACQDLNAKQLGRLLRRAARGAPVDSYVVTRVGIEARRAIWSIERLVGF
jgi:hypothetical protein